MPRLPIISALFKTTLRDLHLSHIVYFYVASGNFLMLFNYYISNCILELGALDKIISA